MRIFFRYLLIIFILSGFPCSIMQAKVLPAKYGLATVSDSAVQVHCIAALDSFYNTNSLLKNRLVVSGIMQSHAFNDKTKDFYLLLSLCLMLGMIRFSDKRYFSNLWKAFWNPTLSNRQLKDQLQGASVTNLLMNLFFTISAGIYLYFVLKATLMTQHTGRFPPSWLIAVLILGIMVIYLSKYLALRFSGWAFRVEGITDQYLFNVFLINKIIGIIVIPVILLSSFAIPAFAEPVIILSFVLIALLFINRYVRSWQVFGSLFQYSKFHFFTYLCASELLPLALLMKLLVKGMMYY